MRGFLHSLKSRTLRIQNVTTCTHSSHHQRFASSSKSSNGMMQRKQMNLQTKKFSSNEKVPEPSQYELRIHALTAGIPFIGFGIMDNAILIWAGDKIDTHLGVVFGISTLCAAAIGNIISDIAGVGLGTWIEDFCARRVKLPKLNLTNAQRNLRSVRFAGQAGNCIGLTIGCIIGMFPLLWIDTEEIQKQKHVTQIKNMTQEVMEEAKSLVGAESTCLFFLVDKFGDKNPIHYNKKEASDYSNKYLYGSDFHTQKVNDEIKFKRGEDSVYMKVGKGLMSKAVTSKEVLNVRDVQNHPDFDETSEIAHLHKKLQTKVQHMICIPIMDVFGNCIGVIQATNKKSISSNSPQSDKELHPEGFSKHDELILKSLGTHISVALQNMHSESDTSIKEVIQMLKNDSTA